MQRHRNSVPRRIATTLILVILSLCFTGASALAQDTVKIGAVLPLSKAAFAQAGEEQRRGLLMALQEINQAGGVLGKKVELIIEDDTGEPSGDLRGGKAPHPGQSRGPDRRLFQHDHLRPAQCHPEV